MTGNVRDDVTCGVIYNNHTHRVTFIKSEAIFVLQIFRGRDSDKLRDDRFFVSEPVQMRLVR